MRIHSLAWLVPLPPCTGKIYTYPSGVGKRTFCLFVVPASFPSLCQLTNILVCFSALFELQNSLGKTLISVSNRFPDFQDIPSGLHQQIMFWQVARMVGMDSAVLPAPGPVPWATTPTTTTSALISAERSG